MEQQILALVKARQNRGDNILDDYLLTRIRAAIEELRKAGIVIRYMDDSDMILVTDYVCWRYANRDKNEGMPEWLKLVRRERWIGETYYDTFQQMTEDGT